MRRDFLLLYKRLQMSKMQNVDFKSMDEFLSYLPDEEYQIVEVLRDIVYQSIPDVSEKLTFNVPFFKRVKTICFIWPAAVLWGSKATYEGVKMGFSYGSMLYDPEGKLTLENRKEVAYLHFHSTKEINRQQIESLLMESVSLDTAFGVLKKP